MKKQSRDNIQRLYKDTTQHLSYWLLGHTCHKYHFIALLLVQVSL